MTTSLIHPRLTESLNNFFSQVCEIQEATESRDTTGAVTKSWSALHSGVRCRVAPAGGGERRFGNQIYMEATHRIELAEAFGDLTEEMQAVVGSQTYDILLAAVDADETITRLMCRIVR